MKTLQKFLYDTGKTQTWLLARLKERGHYKLDAPRLSGYVRGLHFPNEPQLLIDIAEICGLQLEVVMQNFIKDK